MLPLIGIAMLAGSGGLLWLCLPRGGKRSVVHGELVETVVAIGITAGLAVGLILMFFGLFS
jgi:hypothetical protein